MSPRERSGDLSVGRLVLGAILTICGGIAVSLMVWAPIMEWLRTERHLLCSYDATPNSEGYGEWHCPDGLAYIIPSALGTAACLFLAFVVSVTVTHLSARAATRHANGIWMLGVASLCAVGFGVLAVMGGFRTLSVLFTIEGWRAVGVSVVALVLGGGALVAGVYVQRQLRANRTRRAAGLALVSVVLLVVVSILTFRLWSILMWIVLPLGILAVTLLLGGALLVLGARQAELSRHEVTRPEPSLVPEVES